MPLTPPPQMDDAQMKNFLQAIWRTLVIETATTATRPTNNWLGRTLFDASLAKPIWWTGSNWVDATGAIV